MGPRRVGPQWVGGQNPEKVGVPKGGAPRGGAPNCGALKGGAPKGGGPRTIFFLSSLSGGSSCGILVQGPEIYTFKILGQSCEAAALFVPPNWKLV